MAHYLHRLSAFLFFTLGLGIFAAYILWHNNIAPAIALRILLSIDLPLLAAGMLYGGLSVYLSLDPDAERPKLSLFIAIPLAILFLLAILLKL